MSSHTLHCFNCSSGDEVDSAELQKLLADMEAQIEEDNGGIFR